MRSKRLPFLVIIFICCFPLRVYQQDTDTISWEADIRKFEHLDSTESYPDSSILFVGSSSIRLWSTLIRDMAPYPVIQRGYGGAKLSDLVIYAERIIYPHQFGAIVIFIANDIAGKEEDKDPREVARLFRHVLQIIRAKYADSPVFWIAITPTPQRWQVWPLIAEANKRIEEICSKHDNTYFIRTDSAFLNESSQPREELFMPDRLHLNSQGYAVWTAIIKEALENVLSGKLRPQTVPDL